MQRTARGILLLALILLTTGCAARMPGEPRRQSDLITVEEIQERGPFNNTYDLVLALRPRWLRSQGPDSFIAAQGEVQVHMDGNWLGGVQVLRSLAAHGVTSLRWLDPVEAAGRFGMNHSHGTIIVSSAPVF